MMITSFRKMIETLFLITLLSITTSVCGDWVQDGSSLNIDVNEYAGYPSIAFMDTTPFVAWQESTSGGNTQVFVKYFQGSNWVALGGSLNNDQNENAHGPQILIRGSTPYVTYYEGDPAQIYVKKYNGSTWETVGPGSLNVNPIKIAGLPRMEFVRATPHVIWHEVGALTDWWIYSKHFNGSDWIQDGGILNIDSNRSATVPDISVYGDTPYICWSEGTATPGIYKINVKRFTGSDWEQVGEPFSNNDGFAKDAEISLFNDVPYVAWQENSGTAYQIYVKRFNGSVWNSVGGSLNSDSTQNGFTPNIIFVGRIPHVSWHENTALGQDQIFVKSFNGSDWTGVGSVLNIDLNYSAQYPYMAVKHGTDLYAAWNEERSGGTRQIFVKHIDVNPFISQYAPGFSLPGRTVDIFIYGDNFTAPLAVKLIDPRNGQEILGNNLNIFTPKALQCEFDLNNVAQGVYYLKIQGEKGQSISESPFFVLQEVSVPSRWVVNDLGFMDSSVITGFFSGIAIGDLDNDGNQEIFGACRTRNLYRFYTSTGNWFKTELPQGGVGEYYTTVLIADDDNDSVNELFGGALDRHVYRYKDAVWDKEDFGSGTDMIYSLTSGDGANEGWTRIFAGCADGHIYKFHNSLNSNRVDLGSGSGAMYDINIGDGNNDNLLEVYAANQDGKIYQFKKNGTIWNKVEIGNGSDAMHAVEVTDADGDGAREVYGANADGKIYRFQWVVSNWLKTEVGSCSDKLYSLAFSDAENSGSGALYTSCEDGHIYEFKREQGAWNKYDLGSANTPLYDLAIGDADNDNQFEVYAMGEDNHIYQFKNTSFNPTPTPIPGFDGKIISKKYVYAAPNPIRGHIANIVIFTLQNAEVSAKLFTTTNQEVLSFRRQYSAGQHTERINVSNLANGVYLLLVKAKNSEGVEERVIKKIAIVK